jgi:hypothetical protein
MLWLQGSPIKIPPGSDIVLETMKQRGTPLSRENYLMTAGLEEPVSAEEEAEIPRQFQRNPGELT